MGMFFGPKPGSWSTSSASDPRFNLSGSANVGGFMCPPEATEALEKKAKKLGIPIPDDVEFSYMKD